MSARKSLKLLGVLIVGLLILLAVAPLGPAAGEDIGGLRARSCRLGRVKTDQPIKETVYAKTTGSTPTDSVLRQDEVELELWSPSNPWSSIWPGIIDEFETNNPGITVTINFISGGYADIAQQLQTSAMAGDMPDLVLLSSDYIETFYEMDSLIELNAELLPYSGLLNSAGETCNCAGGFFGFPVTVANLAFFYNEMLFDEFGLDYPDSGWTYDDVVAAAETFAEVEIYGLAVPNNGYYFYPIMTGFGGSIFGSSWPTVNLDSSASVNGLGWAADMVTNGYMPSSASSGDAADLFWSVEAAMMFGGAWHLGGLAESEFGVGITHIPDDGYPLVSTQALMIGREDNYDAAHSFIEFVSGYGNMALISDVTGWPSPLESVLDSSSEWLQQIGYAGDAGAKAPYTTVSGVVYSNFDTAVADAFAGRATPDEALSAAADNIREAIGGD